MENHYLYDTIQGFLFVTASALLIFILVKSELKRTNQTNSKLVDTQQKLNEAQKLGKIGNWEFDLKSRNVTGSDEACRIFGFPNRTIIPSAELLEKIHVDDREHYLSETKNWISGRNLKTIQYRIVIDSKVKYIKEKANIEKDSKGQVIRLYGTVQDLTEEIHAQQSIREKESMYRLLAENTTSMVALHKSNGQIEYVSPNIKKVLGYSTKEYLLLEPYERVLPEDAARIKDSILQLIKGAQNVHYEYRFRKKNNEIIWLETTANAIIDTEQKPIGFTSNTLDITKRKTAQHQLEASEKKYRTLFNTANSAISLITFDGKIIEANEFALKLAGIQKKKMTDENAKSLFVDSKMRDKYFQRLEKYGFWNNLELPIINKQGQTVWLNLNSRVVELEDEKYIFSIATDISDKKDFEVRTLHSEQQFRQLFENMPAAYAIHEIITNDEGNAVDYTFLNVNHQFEVLTGLEADNIIGKTVLSVLPQTEKYWIENYGKVALLGEPMVFSNYSTELNKYYEVSAYQPEPGTFATIFMDVTDRELSQQKIQKYQNKLKELIYELFLTEEREKRQLAIDLHDHFSQLLALSKMKVSEFMKANPDASDNKHINDAKKYIDEALNKARSMTYNLSPPVLYELGLIEAMDWYINKIREEENIEIKFFKNIDTVNFKEQIQAIIYRIFTELMVNIIKHAKASSILVIIERVNNNFYLRVSDDGIGFDTEEIGNKESFGLFSIKERVEQLSGIAHFISAKQKGTVVDISIPLS